MYIYYNINQAGEIEYQIGAYYLPSKNDISWWRVPGITHEEE